MGHSHLTTLLSTPTTPTSLAIDALEEYILQRQSKGDTLFQLSLALAELESSTPPHTAHLFQQARIVTNIPPPHDLSPLNGPFTPTPATIIRHLQETDSTLEKSREIILEYTLGRETKSRDKKPGQGGKGTIGRDTLEEISKRLAEIEAVCIRYRPLLLSIRLSLSYFTIPELAKQLLLLAIPDAERTLVQHIRRRLPGEGRFAVGKELQHLEQLCQSRPALRPAFRSAKSKTTLPPHPIHQIPLPAPNRSAVAKLLASYTRGSTPTTPNPSSLTAYALELVSEYLLREKREFMLKTKWAKSGRDQLSKELSDLEDAFVRTHPDLMPIFLVLRRTFGLALSSYDEEYRDMLPAPPDPDFLEPTVTSTTASLYVNPRLSDSAAEVVLLELIESEKEKRPPGQWLGELVDSIARRFPDGSYSAVFEAVKSSRPLHRRTMSTPITPKVTHSRTLSERNESMSTHRKQLPPLETGESSSGWWDVVSAVQTHNDAPWRSPDLPLPPGAEPAVYEPDLGRLEISESPVVPSTPSSRKSPEGLKSRLFGKSPTVKHHKGSPNERWNRDMVASIMGPSANARDTL